MLFTLLLNLVRVALWPLFALRRARAAPKGAYVAVDIDGALADLPPPPARRWLLLRARAPMNPSVARMRELARTIAADPNVAGVLLRVRGVGPGEAVLASMRDVVRDVRATGKDVIAWLPNGAGNRELILASAARLVLLGPETSVAALGYAAEGRYLKRAFERVGVEPEIFARGTYKSAGEMLVREDMSPAEREQLGALLDARFESLTAAVADDRCVDRATVAKWIDEGPHTARAAVELGIADGVAYEDEIELNITAKLELVDLDDYLGARLAGRLRPLRSKPVIGVIEVRGPIVGAARLPLPLGHLASEDRLVASVRAARADKRVKGVVLYIDSPGGSAVASDRIHHEVMRLAEVKPVVAYMANVAASGGYYIAAGAHSIVAQPQTITGSIGVVAARFVVAPVLEKLGVAIDGLKRGAHADMISPTHHLDASERAALDRELDAFYEAFLAVVAKGRGRDVETIRPLAGGRVWSGTAAHANGLVDELGGFDRALDDVRRRVGAGGARLEPRVVRAHGHVPAPPLAGAAARAAALAPLLGVAQGALARIGLGGVVDAAILALHLEGERALFYWPGG